MGKQITYTSTLPEELFQGLSVYASKVGKAKKEIIETALRDFFERQRQQEFINSFKRAKQDEEVSRLSEEGLDALLTY
jgi:predicted transcriptional regulator